MWLQGYCLEEKCGRGLPICAFFHLTLQRSAIIIRYALKNLVCDDTTVVCAFIITYTVEAP